MQPNSVACIATKQTPITYDSWENLLREVELAILPQQQSTNKDVACVTTVNQLIIIIMKQYVSKAKQGPSKQVFLPKDLGASFHQGLHRLSVQRIVFRRWTDKDGRIPFLLVISEEEMHNPPHCEMDAMIVKAHESFGREDVGRPVAPLLHQGREETQWDRRRQH